MKKMVNSKMNIVRKETALGWLLLAPSLLIMLIFTVFPIFRSLYLSLFESNIFLPKDHFVGLQNYLYLFQDSLYWKIMRNTIFFSIITVIPSLALGLIMAKLVNRKVFGIGFLRSVYFYPVILPMIAWASIWQFIYMANNGLVDQISISLGFGPLRLLSNTNTVLPALAFMYILKESGYYMIFFLAGLQSISNEVIEASYLDGITPWKLFWKIEFPLLAPTFLFVSTIAFTNSFKLVDHIIIMTEGAPNNASTTLLYYIYQQGFTNFNYGLSSALTVIMLILLLLVSFPRFLRQDQKIFYS